MLTIQALLGWVLANPEAATACVVGLLSVASGVCEAVGWTRVSKILGTVTFDSGRVVRYAKLAAEVRAALKGKP